MWRYCGTWQNAAPPASTGPACVARSSWPGLPGSVYAAWLIRPGLRGPALRDDAAGDAAAAAAQRHGMVAVIVAAGMDHQGVMMDLG